MTLQEFEQQGGCEGCFFYCHTLDQNEPGKKVCTFHWFDDDSDDWEYGKNCDDISE